MPYAPRPHRPPQRQQVKRVDRRASAERQRKQEAYSTEWNRLSKAYFKNMPLCEDCGAPPYKGTARRHEVDHIIPVAGLDDPLLLLWDNLRTRCRRCHAAKTAKSDAAIRSEYESSGDAATVINKWRLQRVRQ